MPDNFSAGIIFDLQSSAETAVLTAVKTTALRLLPGADVRRELENLAATEQISAAVILGAVGSLSQTNLRFAGNSSITAGKR